MDSMDAPSQYSQHLFVEQSANNSWANLFGYIPKGSRVLDVGCSTGNFGAALQDLKDCTVVGVDINRADIVEARTKLSDARVHDITRDGAGDLGTFDAIVFADVLEHFAEPRDAMRVVHALLREGGIVVYSIPHMGHQSVRLDLLEGRFPYTDLGLLDRTHLHYYDRIEIHDVFASTGFSIIREDPVVHGYPTRWTRDRLSLMGLTASDRFFEMLKQTEAHVYQYVGLAIRSSETAPIPSPTRESLTPPDELLRYSSEIATENERLQAELDALRRRVAEVRQHPLRSVAGEVKRKLFPQR
jgi:2-polyprenyl-3-methyl-5-hydroxy-6-metoxy-1,4-benzoquinol methylase